MKNEMVIVIVNGKPHHFKGDELTSPEQQAILFLKEIDYKQVEF